MVEIILVLDPGASLSKIFYSINSGSIRMLLMPPQVIPTTEEAATDKAAEAISKVPDEQQAWVQWGKEVWAVGQLAKDLNAVQALQGLKWEAALPKVLAALGIIVRKEGLLEPINLKLGLLLPHREFTSSQDFESEIHSALSNFKFQHQRFSVNLKMFRCRPEGAGLLAFRCSELGDLRFQKNIAVLAVGFRDASCLISRHGGKAYGTTKQLFGYCMLLDGIIRRTPGQDYESLTLPVYQAGASVSVDFLKKLPQSQSPPRRKAELAKITSAIKAARAEYWRSFSSWLAEVIPCDTDEIILAGGTAKYLESDLSNRYGSDSIVGVPGLEKNLNLVLPNASIELVPRLVDGYGVTLNFTKEPVLNGKK